MKNYMFVIIALFTLTVVAVADDVPVFKAVQPKQTERVFTTTEVDGSSSIKRVLTVTAYNPTPTFDKKKKGAVPVYTRQSISAVSTNVEADVQQVFGKAAPLADPEDMPGSLTQYVPRPLPVAPIVQGATDARRRPGRRPGFVNLVPPISYGWNVGVYSPDYTEPYGPYWRPSGSYQSHYSLNAGAGIGTYTGRGGSVNVNYGYQQTVEPVRNPFKHGR